MPPVRRRKNNAKPFPKKKHGNPRSKPWAPPIVQDDVLNGINDAAVDVAIADDSFSESDTEEVQFPADKLRRMFTYMLSATEDRAEFIERFAEHIENADVQSGGLPALADVAASCTAEPTQTLSLNLFNVLRQFRVRGPRGKRLLPGTGADASPAGRESFDALWLRLLDWPLSPPLYRRVLSMLPDKVLPHLSNPLRLTDFLLTSYQLGGAVSVLALHSVFYLIQHHNLEYPQFYSKLYSLLTPAAVRGPQRARFFKLLNMFLGSGYLPEYLVAAFVKRLSRLTLTAPAPAQTLLIRMACNLMVRHRGLQRLTDDPRGPTALPEDPYDASSEDPATCGAGQSALWEIKSLRSHVVPGVARAASFVERDIPELEHPLTDLLATTYDDLIQAELDRRQCTEVALTFHKPEGLLSWKEDQLSANWKLL